MKNTSRVLIEKDGKVLFMHRVKINEKVKTTEEFYTLPGGKREKGETPEQTAIREAKEETGFDVEIGNAIWKITDKLQGEMRQLLVFPVTKISGKLELGSPEAERNCETNKYELVWIKIENIENLKINPPQLMIKLKEKYSK